MSKKKQKEKVFLPEIPERTRLCYWDSTGITEIVEIEVIKLNKDLTDDEHWKLSCAIWDASKLEEDDICLNAEITNLPFENLVEEHDRSLMYWTIIACAERKKKATIEAIEQSRERILEAIKEAGYEIAEEAELKVKKW